MQPETPTMSDEVATLKGPKHSAEAPPLGTSNIKAYLWGNKIGAVRKPERFCIVWEGKCILLLEWGTLRPRYLRWGYKNLYFEGLPLSENTELIGLGRFHITLFRHRGTYTFFAEEAAEIVANPGCVFDHRRKH